MNKSVEKPPELRQPMSGITGNYHHAQQDMLETFIGDGPLRKLAGPADFANGKRRP